MDFLKEIVKEIGDGTLSYFESAVNAATCAGSRPRSRAHTFNCCSIFSYSITHLLVRDF